MADNFDEQYMTTRRDTRIWQQAQIERLSTGTEGAGTLEDPSTELAVDAPTNKGTTITDLKLAKPPTADTVPEEVKAEPIAGRKEFTVDTPEVQELRTQAREQLAKISSGQAALEEVGKAGRKVAEAIGPGVETASRALGLDEEAASTVAAAFVEFVGGLPGGEESDMMAGIETALAALPVVAGAVKAGKITAKAIAGAKEAATVERAASLKDFAAKISQDAGYEEKNVLYQGVPEGADPERPSRFYTNNFETAYNHATKSGKGGTIRVIDRSNVPNFDHYEKTFGFENFKAPEGMAPFPSIKDINTADIPAPKGYQNPFNEAVRNLARDERGSVPVGTAKKEKLPGVSTPVTWEEAVKIDESSRAFEERLKTFTDRLSTQRRGVRSDVQVTADSMSPEAISLETFLDLPPGTILKDSDVVAAKRMFKDLAEPVRLMAKWVAENPNDQQAFLSMLEHLPKVDEAVTRIAGAYAESGRTQRLLSQKLPTGGNVVSQTEERVRISDPYIQQWLAFFQQQDQLAAMGSPAMTKQKFVQVMASMQSPEEFMAAAKVLAKPTKWDMFMEYWINGLLSGPQTHATNVLSNAATIAWAIPERALASMFSRSVRPSESLAMLGGILEAQGDAWRLAWLAFKKEESQLGVGKLEGPARAITADALELTGVPGRAVDFLGSIIRLPGRALLASDDYFKSIAFRAELRALAKRESFKQVMESGLTGQAAKNRMRQIEQNILTNPPESIEDAAKEFASYVTFTRDLGEQGQKIQAAFSSPVGRIVMPFVRTPTNIFKYAGERTPLAFASAAVRDEIAAGGERRALALAKISLGAMTMGYMGMLAAEGIITGGGPKDKAVRAMWMKSHQPYSIRVGNEWYRYSRIEPLGSLIGLAADAADIMGQLPEKDADQLASAIVVMVSRNVAQKTFVKGLAGTLNAVSSQDINVVQKFFEKELPTILPASTLLAQTAREVDPVMREVNSIWDAFAARVPGWSATLPPGRNIFGEPRLMGGGLGPDMLSPIYTGSAEPDAVADELVRLELGVSMPSKQIDGVPLTPQEYDAFVVLQGSKPIIGDITLKDRLADLMKSDLYKRSSDGPDGGKAVLIRQWVSAYRDMAKHVLDDKELSQQYLQQDFPELRDQLVTARDKKSQMFNAPSIR